MSSHPKPSVQELFIAALEVAEPDRAAWLENRCNGDERVFREVMSLLNHDRQSDDPLEQGLNLPADAFEGLKRSTQQQQSSLGVVDSKTFLSKLSTAGILSADEVHAAASALQDDPSSSSPDELARSLVEQGKLTPYQASALLEGQPELLIDKYLILDLIDVGGMGTVFKAIHRTMNRVVAIKMIAQQWLATDDQVRRFQREVRVAATLEHQNIVRAYDADRANGAWFLVMEYVQGKTLDRIVKTDGPFAWQETVNLILQAANGLAHAHDQGIIHRDIKPGNLMINQIGVVKILDLGLANVRVPDDSNDESSEGGPSRSLYELTTNETVLGTVSYMSPEQSQDARTADARSDIYSLACTWYFLLTGEPVFSGDSIIDTFLLHREAPIPSIREKRPDVPESIDRWLKQMLAKDPAHRLQSMSNLIEVIKESGLADQPSFALAGRPDSIVSPPDPAAVCESAENESTAAVPESSKSNRTKEIAISSCVILLASGIFLLYSVFANWQNHQKPSDPPVRLDAATASAVDLLKSGQYEWRIVERLPAPINNSSFVGGADLSEDECLIVFSQKLNDDPNPKHHFWMSSRAGRNESWSEPIRLGPEINGSYSQFAPFLSPDGLVLSYVDSKTKKRMQCSRPTRDANWSSPEPVQLPGRKNHSTTMLSEDQLTLVTTNQNIAGNSDIYWATRESLDSEWGEAIPFSSIINSDQNETRGILSNDRRVLLFERSFDNEDGSKRYWRSWVSVRTDPNSDWSEPMLVDSEFSLGAEHHERNAVLLPDQKTIVICSQRPGSQASDIYLARIVKKKDDSKSLPD